MRSSRKAAVLYNEALRICSAASNRFPVADVPHSMRRLRERPGTIYMVVGR